MKTHLVNLLLFQIFPISDVKSKINDENFRCFDFLLSPIYHIYGLNYEENNLYNIQGQSYQQRLGYGIYFLFRKENKIYLSNIKSIDLIISILVSRFYEVLEMNLMEGGQWYLFCIECPVKAEGGGMVLKYFCSREKKPESFSEYATLIDGWNIFHFLAEIFYMKLFYYYICCKKISFSYSP